MPHPLIGITCDGDGDRQWAYRTYSAAIAKAGGVPVLLPHEPALAREYLTRCDGMVLTGGDDPRMERWGQPTHPKATPILEARQTFELALLDAAEAVDLPLLGICLGMQLMALHAGGSLDQHLPDSWPTHAEHWGRVRHPVAGTLGSGEVLSHHRQGVVDPGTLAVVARAHDGLIEAVRDPRRRFYLGVQWHPERMEEAPLGGGLMQALVEEARRRRA